MDTNLFLVFSMSNFIYGIKVFAIDMTTLETKISKIEKPEKDETIEDCLERLMMEYNSRYFVFKSNFDTNIFEKHLIDCGYRKYSLPKGE